MADSADASGSTTARILRRLDPGRFTVGIRLIDAEHRELIGLFNLLAEATGPQAVHDALAALSRYAVVHFTVEEELMVAYGFPGYAAHKAQHDAFAQRVRDLREGPELGAESLPGLRMWLARWLVRHLDGEDRLLARHIQSVGL